MDFVGHWSRRTGLAQLTLVLWLGIAPSKYHDWKKRYGRANEHNGQIPRDFWLEDWEREAIVEPMRNGGDVIVEMTR